ncbi:MAG: hypothetical protein ACAH06_06350 [Methylophilaceae bacterium]
MRVLIISAVALILTTSSSAQEQEQVDRAKAAIGRNLKDPYSAVYEGIYFGKTAKGDPVVCGTVNAKNSMGGYTGRKRFYYFREDVYEVESGKQPSVILEAFCLGK